MQDQKILIVHPYDQTTSFLDDIVHHLCSKFYKEIQYFSISPNEYSHQQCLQLIISYQPSSLIIFLGHGRSDRLYGSRADEYLSLVSYDAIAEYPEKYYSNENFINIGNIEVFREKKVFCLACNSNDKIARFAIEKGVKTFLGFGDIPTSKEEFENIVGAVSQDFVDIMKVEFNYIIKTSLAIAISKGLSFKELFHLIHIITNQRLTYYLINQKEYSERYILADSLYLFKKGMTIYGDRDLKFTE